MMVDMQTWFGIQQLYADYAAAEEVWRSKARATIDDAEMKYVIVHLHRLLEPHLPEQ